MARGRLGGAARLRRYWTRGVGGRKKVRWGTPGDFNRCVRHLRKYVRDPKGYCALRHHAALGIWPATHAKLLRAGRR
jgi:hypothetical protein